MFGIRFGHRFSAAVVDASQDQRCVAAVSLDSCVSGRFPRMGIHHVQGDPHDDLRSGIGGMDHLHWIGLDLVGRTEIREYDAQQVESPVEDLSRLPPSLHMAEEMGEGLE